MKPLAALLLALPVFGAAQYVPIYGPVGGPGGSAGPNGVVDWKLLATGEGALEPKRGIWEYESANALQNAWPALTGQPPEAAPTRDVDWNRYKAVAVTGGDLPGGSSLRILGVGTGVLRVGEVQPARGERSRRTARPYVVALVEKKVGTMRLAWSKIRNGVTTFPWQGRFGPVFNDLPFWNFAGGSDCLWDGRGIFEIGDGDAFFRWQTERLGPSGRIPRLAMDWTRDRLVAVHLGREGAGRTIRVLGLEREAGGYVLHVASAAAFGAGEGPAPWTLIRVPRAPGRLRLAVDPVE